MAKASISKRTNIDFWWWLLAIWLISLLLASAIADKWIEGRNQVYSGTSAKPASDQNPPPLSVQPSSGQPEPLEFNLQGSSPGWQTSTGGLQRPSRDQQPSVSVPNIENLDL